MVSLNEYIGNNILTGLIDTINEDKYVGSSDTAILARLAMHKWNHMERANKNGVEKAKRDYPGIPNDKRALARWFRDANGKLVPSELEFIPRSDWNMLEQIGEIESSLMSPHKWSYFEYICKNPRPKKNKVLTVIECCNSKPYCQDSAKQWYFSRFRSFTDFACGAYGIVPEEYSQLYPVREDEWAHSDESPSVAKKYNLVSCNRGYQYIKAMGYDYIVVFFQNPDPEEFMRWMVNMPNMKDKIKFVVTPEFVEKIKHKYPQFGNGLVVTRMVGLPITHEQYMKVLKSCLDGEDRKRFSEIEKLVKDEDKAGQKKWIEETNEKFGLEPWRTDRPGWEVKLPKSERKLHSYDSDVTDAKVSEAMKWISSWAEEQGKKDIEGDKIDWYKERLIFTPLDLIMDHYKLDEKNPKKLDVDEEYWDVMAALERNADKLGIKRVNPDKYHRYDYLWCFEKVYKKLKKEGLIKYCDKEGLSQFDQNVLDR